MKVSSDRIIEVQLILNEKEARWLKANMQNPLHNQDPIDESDVDVEMREAFFTACATAV